jgi:hypothetical protein
MSIGGSQPLIRRRQIDPAAESFVV